MLLRNLFFTTSTILAVFGATLTGLLAADQPRSWPPEAFLPLAESRVAALPEAEQAAWRNYLETSSRVAKTMPAANVPDFSPDKPLTAPLGGAKHTKGIKENASHKYYETEEARATADNVVSWQVASGGWTKGNDYSNACPARTEKTTDTWAGGTFDNDATIMELRFLAHVILGSPKDKRADAWRASFLRGLQYIFNAQYPNGGFPQIYPLVGGYHDAITYNDNAMVRVLELLRDVAAGKPEYAFVPAEQKAEAIRRLSLGVKCILLTQIVEPNGRRTAWCQQHDMLTLKPCAARNFEPIAAVSNESSHLVLFLMSLPAPSAELVSAVDDAAKWLEHVEMRGVAWDRHTQPTKLVDQAGARALWSRYYEIGTDKPIFGDRDRTIHYVVGEISHERQKGYAWFGQWPLGALEAYQGWRKNVKTPAVR